MKIIKSALLLGAIAFICSGAHAQIVKDWATYYGKWKYGSGTLVFSTAFDPVSGCIYVAGETTDSTGIATPGSFKSSFHSALIESFYDRDLFLAKFDTLGHRLWATYYGGSGMENGAKVAVDGMGNVFLCGMTGSNSGIATQGSHLSFFYGPNSAYPSNLFLVKFDANGNRIWGTYYGGDNTNTPPGASVYGLDGLLIDKNNNIYISGSTGDTIGIATPGAFKESSNFSSNVGEAFIAKFNNNGVRLWGTYYGGEAYDAISSLYMDNAGNLYGLGNTQSTTGIATPNAAQTQLGSPQGGAFLVKFTPSGQRLWGTYIGGPSFTYPLSLCGDVKDENGGIYVSGYTASTSNIATAGSYQTIYGGGDNDAFLMRYDMDGHKIWGTYFGGEGSEVGTYVHTNDMALDENNEILFVGATSSLTHIQQHGCGYMGNGYNKGFMARFKLDGSLRWSGYYDAEMVSVLRPYNTNAFYVTGNTTFDGLATPGALMDTKQPSDISGFITKFKRDCPNTQIVIQQTGNHLSVDGSWGNYQWYMNGNAVNGATTASIDALGGNYFVKINDSCGCTYFSDTVAVSSTAINGVVAGLLDAEIIPNPNNGNMVLHVSDNTNKQTHYNYKLMDMTGRMITSGHFTKDKPTIDYPLHLTYLKSGIYLMELSNENAKAVLKWVKE